MDNRLKKQDYKVWEDSPRFSEFLSSDLTTSLENNYLTVLKHVHSMKNLNSTLFELAAQTSLLKHPPNPHIL